MEDKITKLALEAGLLNYVDNETPRHYFVDGYADVEEVQKFAELIVRECCEVVHSYDASWTNGPSKVLKAHFGVKE